MSNAVRRVLLLATGTDLGGAELQVFWLASELKARGWKVLVVGMIPPGPVATRLQSAGIACESLGMPRGRPTWQAVRRLRETVRLFDPDVVHSHMVHANILARVAVGGSKGWPPLICTVHNMDEGGGWRPWAYRFTDHLAYRTTHCSRIGLQAQRRAGLLSTSRSLWIPNALRFPTAPTSAKKGSVGSEFRWCYVGRLEPVKRLPHLLACFSSVLLRHPDAKLQIVGGGADEAALRAACREEALRSAVTLVGPQEDVRPWLAAADGFVSLASREGMPLTILEAGSHALPVVVTGVGGVPELVPSADHGWLVEQSQDSAVAAMCAVMDLSADQRQIIGNRLRTHILSQYSGEVVLPQWLALYDAAIQSRRVAA